ncbi:MULTISPECIES: glycosyltransferase family 2 protein [unclassified Leptolyngbya]|uniref:glycosyltransferase family 2 protein n=1 Tax=unclassified Leptolyngbya TaxID=2650499 RepID=UPI00168A1E34|nr:MULTISPECIES: glycosyltransferase family 2 protein [unclassified Leptolyngbya]MBD1913103.1 glycosyltransferase family 2 protein [Leptolyngbya sp. FACHB-8]MBD2153239.1 glycosyltransferase family 2 protein [Leptolyngbya sp. FACHB-16]
MLFPIKVVDIELTQPLPTFEGLEAYMGLKGLVRLHGVPLGYVEAPISLGRCTAETLSKRILEQHSWDIICQLLKNGLASPQHPKDLSLENLIGLPPVEYEGEWPLVTVAVCTRDRPDDMKLCLEALSKLDYPHLDILVVDNAPQTGSTKELVANSYPSVRYVREPRPGLDWARNRAILEAKGEIIAYTDDDVVVDPGWVKALARVFSENTEVMAVTGLVVPYELETQAQVIFESNGGFGRGFEQHWYRKTGSKLPWQLLGTGQFGTGANMAYRRSLFSKIGHFDPALDVGTVTNGGGDLEMYFRVLQEGYTLVYEPRAMVRHRHRASYEKLKAQITNNGIGLYSYFVCGATSYPDERSLFLWIGLWWFVYWNLRRLWINFKHPTRIPSELVWGEMKGSLTGLFRYQQACQRVRQIVQEFGEQIPELETNSHAEQQNETVPVGAVEEAPIHYSDGIAIRQVRLEQPLQPLTDICNYGVTRVFLTLGEDLLGSLDIDNRYHPISVDRLLNLAIPSFSSKLAEAWLHLNDTEVCNRLQQHYRVVQSQPVRLPEQVKVTINLATFDRPDDLRNCLRCLLAQDTQREVEIVVVDNHPSSGLTPPVVAEFPSIKLVNEPRQGLAYARNAGFVASTGEIIIATDDDVTLPSDWLEKILAPFARHDVMIVTGNVLPIQLETLSQQAFEEYGGLGRGFRAFEVGGDWFESVPRYALPTWSLGATANAAFRAAILSHPEIGLMDEALGPGMPSGVGEDTYLFYKTIKAGYTLVYEPSAYVWHKHRNTDAALRRQLYGYSKGHVSYNLTTWFRDGDWRGIYQILIGLSSYHLKRLVLWMLGRRDYPLSLILLEIWGNLAGPWSLWQSHRRVEREGKSDRYIPPAERSEAKLEAPVELMERVGVTTLEPFR